MPVSMFRLSVPVFLHALAQISVLLDKAEAHATEGGIDLSVLVNARLASDMLPLSGQIQRLTDTAKNTIGRLTTVAAPAFPDTEQSFPELRERIYKTVTFLETIVPSDFAGAEEREVTLSFGKLKATFTGEDYMLSFALPNFFFHVTTAYAILRHNGVAIGKQDFLGRIG